MSTFTPTEPYACANGDEAEIGYTTKFGHHGQVRRKDTAVRSGLVLSMTWNLDGTNAQGMSDYDLVNTPKPSTAPERVWVRMREGTGRSLYSSAEDAKVGAETFGGTIHEYKLDDQP